MAADHPTDAAIPLLFMLMAPLLARGRAEGCTHLVAGVFLMILSAERPVCQANQEFPGGLLAMDLRAVNHHIWTYNACRKNCG